MKNCMDTGRMDYGPYPYIANIERLATENLDYRKAIWTGDNLQMTLMCIPRCGEIGVELHEDVDQLIRVEFGEALALYGNDENCLNMKQVMTPGDAIFVPAGTWHNVINVGNGCLRISSVYAPPHHPRGTVQLCKKSQY